MFFVRKEKDGGREKRFNQKSDGAPQRKDIQAQTLGPRQKGVGRGNYPASTCKPRPWVREQSRKRVGMEGHSYPEALRSFVPDFSSSWKTSGS